MSDIEVPLAGGNASEGVVRVGDTVRKPAVPGAASVRRYVEFLRAHGIEAPEPLGIDEQGREITAFVEGRDAQELLPFADAELARAGALLRAIHEASESFDDDHAEWEPLLPVADADLICHNDFAPWNLLVGERWTVIDWDGAGPSNRLWDLAYSAQAFAQLEPSWPAPVAAARLRAFVVDGYGASAALREALPDALARRTAAMHELLRSSAESGRQPWGRMYAEGHGQFWAGATAYTAEHASVWATALR